MATVVDSSPDRVDASSTSTSHDARSPDGLLKPSRPVYHRPLESSVITTLYDWPSIEPVRFESYPSRHLDLPLRRDILHRAVIFEGDATRRGTASTKWRGDVRGSNRKIQPQKGTGRARVGDKKSPIRRGGGVAFGPHPRDFSTGLNRKIYDIAWRTALSYRYRKGELILIDNTISMPWQASPHLLNNLFEQHKWGAGFGRSTLVTLNSRTRLNKTVDELGHHAVVKDLFDVDVKDLLETGRIIIEKYALDAIIAAHSSDLGKHISLGAAHSRNQKLFKKYREETMGENEDAFSEEGYEEEPELDVAAAQDEVQHMGR